MPAYKAERIKDGTDAIVSVAYNALVVAIATTMAWVAFPHFGIWKSAAVIAGFRLLIHGEFLPSPPAPPDK